MKLPLASAKASRMRAHSSLAAPHPRSAPKVIVPRQSSETRRPLRPSSLYRMSHLPGVVVLLACRIADKVSGHIVRTCAPYMHYASDLLSPTMGMACMPRPVARRDRPSRGEVQRDLRRAILDATEGLLVDHRFDQLTVADILSAARVSRASFYFYFQSKHAVLAELVRAVVDQALEVAQPWLKHDGSPQATLHQGTPRRRAPVASACPRPAGHRRELA